jgi:PncC family amidohydrolase
MSLEEETVKALTQRGEMITTAESCTGGMLAAALVNVAGVSGIFKEGYITYANESKQKLLGVKKETLDLYGAVSEQTAAEMARGAALSAQASVSLATTGIAGPDGGTEEKPVGLVYIGCYVHGRIKVLKNRFQGDRRSVREQTVQQALRFLLACLSEEE